MSRYRRGATDLNGVLLLDKPAGMTSHDVVDSLRRLTGEGRIGHAGTLDPAATGLLVLCVGPATRAAQELTAADKSYLASIAFGQATDTDDAEGRIIATGPVPATVADPDFARQVLAGFTGVIQQLPPQFSAIKQHGVPAYRQARQGQPVELTERTVTIYQLELLAARPDGWDIAADVSKGTYLRALARDIGAAVGCPAHLAALRRTRVGQWPVSAAWTLAGLVEQAAAGRLSNCFLEI